MREILTNQNLQLTAQFFFTAVIVTAHYCILILSPVLIFNYPPLVPGSPWAILQASHPRLFFVVTFTWLGKSNHVFHYLPLNLAQRMVLLFTVQLLFVFVPINRNLFDFPLIKGPEVLSRYLIRHGALVKSFLRTLILMTQVALWLLPLLELICNCIIYLQYLWWARRSLLLFIPVRHLLLTEP